MSRLPINKNRDAEPIRLFKSDFMEFFTHISPVAIVVLWLPIVGWFLATAILDTPAGVRRDSIAAGFVGGLFLWTFAEYTLHRFVFHFAPRTPAQERIAFLFHGIHHAQPQVKTRLVMPFPVSIPLALILYGLVYLVAALLLGARHWVAPLMSGSLLGYMLYDLTHYATHHWTMRSGVGKFLKRHHMAHHYKDPASRFGVSSPLWDHVFGTQGSP